MTLTDPKSKIVDESSMHRARKRLKQEGRRLVFTNGCFDILHAGHVDYLHFARTQGDALLVAINSDASVKRNKGPARPIVGERDRARVLAALECVDYVLVFDDDEPLRIIGDLLPDILVKGEDWAHYVSGRDAVEANGGTVVLAPLVPERSTTNIIRAIESAAAGAPPSPGKAGPQ